MCVGSICRFISAPDEAAKTASTTAKSRRWASISCAISAGSPMKILILGGGPAGLGAAWRLKKLGHRDWQLLEANDYAGGLASSFRDENGFFWDIGGHVQFSHYEYFDALMHELIPKDQWLIHERESWMW